MFQNGPTRLATIAALALFAGACGDNPSSPSGDGGTIADYVASASVEGAPGALQSSGVPRPTSGGPTITVDGHLTIVNGGTTTLTVSSATPFTKVFVAGSPPISRLFIPVSGFYEVPLPAPTTSADLLIVFPQVLPANAFQLYFAAADPSGKVGTVEQKSVSALHVGTGDVQVTAAWDADSDVDLHVVDPAGTEIYWGNRQSPSGGQLDLDSNAACAIDGVRNENITWAVGTAPQGDYTVRLDYWSSCDVSATNYTVLINNGGAITIQHGTFHGSGDTGGYGSGVPIGTFTRTTGPAAAPMPSGSIALLPTHKSAPQSPNLNR
ncbi:MAG: hypothetical protein U0167_00525 [bacterium]